MIQKTNSTVEFTIKKNNMVEVLWLKSHINIDEKQIVIKSLSIVRNTEQQLLF